MNYTFFASLANEISLPEKGILSNVVHKDEYVNITAFGFAAGQELSSHSAPTPAAIYFLEGEAEVRLGDDTVSAGRFFCLYAAHAHTWHLRKISRKNATHTDQRPWQIECLEHLATGLRVFRSPCKQMSSFSEDINDSAQACLRNARQRRRSPLPC